MFLYMMIEDMWPMTMASGSKNCSYHTLHYFLPLITGALALLFRSLNRHASNRLWLITAVCVLYPVLLQILFFGILHDYTLHGPMPEWRQFMTFERTYGLIAVVLGVTIAVQSWWESRGVDKNAVLRAGLARRE